MASIDFDLRAISQAGSVLMYWIVMDFYCFWAT